MQDYVQFKLWTEASPRESHSCATKEAWVLQELLRLPPITDGLETSTHVIYTAFDQFNFVHNRAQNEHSYLDGWNSARSDLIAREINPPEKLVYIPEVKLQIVPEGDISYWLISYVLGFSEEEIQCVCPVGDVTEPGLGLMPLLKECYKTLRTLTIDKDDLLTRYHRCRYLLIRFYLDAHYHEVLQ